jgi:hypothetical protein
MHEKITKAQHLSILLIFHNYFLDYYINYVWIPGMY